MSSIQPLNTTIQLNTQNSNAVEIPSEVVQPCNLNECNTPVGEVHEIHNPTDNNCLSWNLLFSGKGMFRLQFDQNLKIVTLLECSNDGDSVIKKGMPLLDYQKLINANKNKPEEPQIPQENLPCSTTSELTNLDDMNEDKEYAPGTVTPHIIMEKNHFEINSTLIHGIYPLLSNCVKKIHVLQMPEFEYYNLNYESCVIKKNIDEHIPQSLKVPDNMEVYQYIGLSENIFNKEFNDNNCKTINSLSRYLTTHESPVSESLKKSNSGRYRQ